VRSAPTVDDITLFTGTGLTPVGNATAIDDRFINLLPQTVEGLDFGFGWEKRRTEWGTFIFRVNASQLLTFSREPGDIVDSLYAARDAGVIDALTPLPDSSQLIAQNGRPEWRVNANFTWRHGPWRVGLSSNYVSEVFQTGLLSSTGQPWRVSPQLIGNANVRYDFEQIDASLRAVVRDFTDEGPSLADGGYLARSSVPTAAIGMWKPAITDCP